MISRARPGLAALALVVAAACGSSSLSGSGRCAQPVDACGRDGAVCDPTWGAVLTDTAYCGDPLGPTDQFSIFDCAGYHVLHRMQEAVSTDAYYDATSGALVAVVGPNDVGAPTCNFGPAGGFSPPACPTVAHQMPTAWCPGDAGTDGSPGQ